MRSLTDSPELDRQPGDPRIARQIVGIVGNTRTATCWILTYPSSSCPSRKTQGISDR
jgi:hypothetical protein